MRKRVIGGLAVTAAGLIALAACSSGSSGSSTPTSSTGASQLKNGTFTYAIDQGFSGFNINNVGDNEFVLQEVMNYVWPSVYMGTPNVGLQLNTDLVTSATVTNSNPQTIVYQISPKATWSDGVPINADDFVYNWQAQSGNPKYKDVGGKAFEPASTAGYQQIKSVTGSNGGKTVTVVMASPFGDWKTMFSDLMPAHIAKVVGFNNGFQTYNSAVQVSGGPYMISGYTQNQDVIETLNPHYWGAKPKLTKLTFRIFADDNQMPPAMQNNEINAANPAQASLTFKEQIASVPGVTDSIIPGLEFQHIDFNEANPYLAKVGVRQAIAYGTDRNQMVQRLVGPVTSAITPLNNRFYVPQQAGYKDTSNGLGAFDPTKAKSLLQAAGMTMGSDGYFHPNFGPQAGKDLTLSISTTSGEPVRADIEQLFQADMKAIGIKINIQNYPPSTLFGTVGPKSEFDIIEFAWVLTPFVSGSVSSYCSYTNASNCGNNWNHYANSQVDSLLNQAQAAIDPTTAAGLYNQADALMWQDMATLPLYTQPQLYAYSSNWGNVIANPTNFGLTWNQPTWGLKSS